MKSLTIQTSRSNGGFKAWLKDAPQTKASSTSSPSAAATNLAVRLFFGHNHFAQLDAEEVRKVDVKSIGNGSFRATYRDA
jgi:hypothetical protein